MRIIDCHYEQIAKPLLNDGAPTMQLIDVTGAAKRFWLEDQEYYDITDDFPCVVPPFQSTWMEYRAPIKGVHPAIAGGHFGCHAFSVPINPEIWREAVKQDVITQFLIASSKYFGSKHFNLDFDKEQERQEFLQECADGETRIDWVSTYRVVFMDKRKRLHEVANLMAYLDEYGQIVKNLHLIYHLQQSGKSVSVLRTSQIFVMPFLFALSLCHAKNVTIEAEPLPPKAWQKRQDRGYRVDFKILQIHPYQQRKNSESNNTNIMPLHLVRGHFKDYRKGDGLFGKIKKLVWFDMHTRGNPEIGMVIKDYEV